ncbi:MAG: hypothetical protein HQK65_08845 [Desulfamplus sp.]|nr:hypothetical protein [Desulfamplus sp.]
MKNRKALGLLVALMISVLCVGNAFAFDASARDDSTRVTVGQNYYGDVLLGQIYQTQWNYDTVIKVINTRNDRAVVARVVFRSAMCSAEVLDFLIYLTPTDMWEGVVRMNAAGLAEIYSTDDSVLASSAFEWNGTAACNPFSGVWASEETPFQRAFSPILLSAGDTTTFGHVEVIGLASYPATAPLDKDTLAMAYGNLQGVPAVPIANLIACDFNLDGTSEDVSNTLTGTLTLENSFYDQTASINMVALKNWDNAAHLNSSVITEFPLSSSVNNSVAEIEATLAKQEYSIPFNFSDENGYLDTVIINTLPTHYMRGQGSAFWLTRACTGIAGNITYRVYDMMETILLSYISPLRFSAALPEVSMQALLPNIQGAVNAGYVKGWVKVGLAGGATGNAMAPNTTVTYAGVPILNSYINVAQNFDMDWNYAASPESAVTYNGVTVRQ